ncbi:MAG: DNA-directed RNA polymerase subunit beta, DNA-directed RNA polymerase subunit beta [Berkelbacteria bacterium GW2011_GWE1_39_12]|uniref:DNA-directed RNA polymerase subunit beta n=1 Tax=Berkelbacteria bacterium GW2011_GWE1_39_12 TaxID=1618337 RepID=A0A0G4B4Z6_9BACT|nr:MAG: DNA-directed RNA polymerase subunit beta, DNA-directed RNA polymerase subunit beta [Berkelbacteria bacterium GW2011_GWE1_39_12]
MSTQNRLQFSKPKFTVPLPNLIEVQTQSYDWFFKEGIRELLDEISPVDDFTGKVLTLEFLDYSLDAPTYDEQTAKTKNLTFEAPLKCNVRLTNKISGKTKDSSVFLGVFPLMTDRGTFIVNGIERVVVSQIVRSYGVLFVSEEVAGRKLFGCKIIPSRGAWLEFETSNRDIISVKVDRKRKILFTTFLRALGLTDDQIIHAFEGVNDNADHDYVKATLAKDTAKTFDEAVVDVYKRIRPGDLATAETARSFLEAMFFNPKRYDLGRVGRYKMNQRLNIKASEDLKNRILRVDDVVEAIKEIIRLNNDPMAEQDDIDHLRNRRVRAVGELVQAKVRVGLLRMERIIKDRMSVLDPDTVTPAQLINARPIAAVLQEFFASSQMSQFMNQTNPLAELEHKRCLSATGPGGLSRERAGFEVRDVHRSHYGRVCPIETPEGPNIGLVGYMASYARINEYGFIESPYLVVEHVKGQKPKITNKVVYLDADEEDRVIVAPASTDVDKDGYITATKTVVREFGEPVIDLASKIEYIDVSPKQIVSISTALIPFVEHNDAVRASMGSNMERQAVPLVRPTSPVVGTGMEADAARDSGQCLFAKNDGVVTEASGSEIVVGVDRYRLEKFIRSNQATCINQRPVVRVGDKVKKGQILADSSATEEGELALGQNVLVAFMPFKGGNFEDAIILSEKLVRNDNLTSIHIEKYSTEVRDTKLGPEVLTRDIPNVGEGALANLDEQGIVRIGAEVSAGDILVGKITPKGETELSAEEKLLRAIFGEKAKDVKDTSLRLPHGEYGKVVNVEIFSKEAGDELPAGVYQMVEVAIAQLRKVQVGDKLAGRHGNKGVISMVLPEAEMPYMPDGTPVDIILNPLGVISRMNLGQLLETHLGWAANKLGYKIAVPVFESMSFEDIQAELKKAGLPEDGKVQLHDGRTGEPFAEKTTVGIKYMMKLCHLVDDKMHARSTGPYSMVTQQPLGGKSQFGGQRFGEMEVWALEGYGAAHSLQEMLTIKSDDVVGRSKAYEAIIKGEQIQKPSIPASFFVLVKELQSLGLNVEMLSAADLAKAAKKISRPAVGESENEKEDNDINNAEELDAEVTELKEEEPPMVEPSIDEGEDK